MCFWRKVLASPATEIGLALSIPAAVSQGLHWPPSGLNFDETIQHDASAATAAGGNFRAASFLVG
jgi:hypothetical protein